MYRDLLLAFGIWDQMRVDQGHEFYLMCYLQHKLKDLRFNTNRNAYVQTTSRMVSFLNFYSILFGLLSIYNNLFKNRVIERVWHEVNQRIIYQIKESLVHYELESVIDLGI